MFSSSFWMFSNSKYRCSRVFVDICQMLCAYVYRCYCWWWRFTCSKIPYPTTRKEKKKKKITNIQQTRQINENMSHTWICSLLDGHASVTVSSVLFSFFVSFCYFILFLSSVRILLCSAQRFIHTFDFVVFLCCFIWESVWCYSIRCIYHHQFDIFGDNSPLFYKRSRQLGPNYIFSSSFFDIAITSYKRSFSCDPHHMNSVHTEF